MLVLAHVQDLEAALDCTSRTFGLVLKDSKAQAIVYLADATENATTASACVTNTPTLVPPHV
jgi:hypothetical protein